MSSRDCDDRRMDPIDEAILRELTARCADSVQRPRRARRPVSERRREPRPAPRRQRHHPRLHDPDRAPPPSLPAGLEVFVEVRMADGTTNEDFTAALARGFPQVLDAVHVTGSYDYLLHAVVADPAALDQFVRRLKREAGAGQTFTRLALRG